MRNILNPKWLFVINTLPLAVLFFLLFGQFGIIKTLLDDNTLWHWKIFGLVLGLLGLLNFAYAAYATLKKKKISAGYAGLSLAVHIGFMYLYAMNSEKIIPFSVPRWMVSSDLFLYVGTFLMPTLAHALFILVYHFTSETKKHNAPLNFLAAIGVPVAGYLFTQTILPLWKRTGSDFENHVLLVLFIVATLIFHFFLVRGAFVLATKKEEIWRKYRLAWKIPIALVFPLAGLLLNKSLLSDFFNPDSLGIFGNFNHICFYILAVVNGIFICLPNLDNRIYRLFLFAGRSITFAYTLYFFLVFLPFLPLSVIAVMAIGTGFLMLTPLLLFVIHLDELSKDFVYLKKLLPRKLTIGIFVSGFLVIPASITGAYLKDRHVLNETLAYLYSPDYSKQYDTNKNSLQKTLGIIKHHKRKQNGLLFSCRIPYLSAYFNWLVMDNLTLSDAKIENIEKIFFGSPSLEPVVSEDVKKDSIQITGISVNSIYDKSQNAWRSRVDLEVTDKSGNARFSSSEYATTFDLPDGCWISDYYLHIGDKKESGILAEKKSALWIFSNIVSENKDPGILYYLTGNKAAFRIFPFAKGEARKTGIEFLHKEPVRLAIDRHIVELGNADETVYEDIETENIAYVSARRKQSLKSVERKPHFHFLIDVSKGKSGRTADFIERIERVAEQNKALAENAEVSFVNSYVHTLRFDADWKEEYGRQIFEGGFYLDRAIRNTLFNAYKSPYYPVMVVVTDSLENAVLDKDFADFKFAFPESDSFFTLDGKGILRKHSLTENPIKERAEIKGEPISGRTVLEYRLADNSIVYLPDDDEPSIVLKKEIVEVPETAIQEKSWKSALEMQGMWRSQILHPEISDKEWTKSVKYSFISKVMTPFTSYIVVENEAQKAILKKKQQQVLSGNKSLNLDEDTQRMSEPSLILLTLLLGLILWFGKKRPAGKNFPVWRTATRNDRIPDFQSAQNRRKRRQIRK